MPGLVMIYAPRDVDDLEVIKLIVSASVEDYVKSVIGKLGENMQVKRFARFSIGA